MKIAQLCLSPDLGGLELYVARLAEWQSRHGYDCTAVVRPGTRLASRVAEEQIPLFQLRVKNKYLPLLAARRLARFIDDNAIDVLHAHWKYDLPLAVWAKRLARRPVRLAHSRHMVMPHSKHDAYHRFLYHHLDAFIGITEQIRRQALAQLPLDAARIHCVHPGVAKAQAADCAAFWGQLEAPRRRFMVGLIGRIKHFKGQHLLIEALEEMVEAGGDVGALIIGHAMEDAYLDGLRQRVARGPLRERVQFLGFVNEPATLMGCFDAVVLTSVEETFGLVLIEAMRAGTAVIGTAAGGVPEIIEDDVSGLLIPPNDGHALAGALARLYRDPALRQRLAQAGRERADRLFDQDRQFERLTGVLTGLTS